MLELFLEKNITYLLQEMSLLQEFSTWDLKEINFTPPFLLIPFTVWVKPSLWLDFCLNHIKYIVVVW